MNNQAAPNKLHCFHCFDVLLSKLDGNTIKPQPPFDDEHYPLFVTWRLYQDPSGAVYSDPQLRGCIGNFCSLSLHKGLGDYAIIAAMEDSRFSPISIKEVEQLECGVSLLTDFEPAEHIYDWVVGVHGIRIEFEYKRKRHSSTFLPDVASSQGWDHQETLRHLVRKAGYRGEIESIKDTIKTIRYQSRKCQVTYDDYRKWLEQGRQV
jgi:AMME syndrome candidate gene 1 protein